MKAIILIAIIAVIVVEADEANKPVHLIPLQPGTCAAEINNTVSNQDKELGNIIKRGKSDDALTSLAIHAKSLSLSNVQKLRDMHTLTNFLVAHSINLIEKYPTVRGT
ncbi:PREDICTED: uncharacterized protein LOC105449006 [Wasmannia auropunctata]|uniref:uncharacterized protein LOC105449006 n=1 Tax=Wasmannia auropunctata TaxID=64793 RepID=UPI0005F09882|nr:PREDICTED: uncharacterized protein LOC105449006 [Wasmannia auropunctata]